MMGSVREKLKLARDRLVGGNGNSEKLRRQLRRKDQELAELRKRLSTGVAGSDADGMKPENVVWVFCTGRSGSTWLGSMMGGVEGHAMWNEPLVGALFGEFYYQRAAHKRGAAGILGEPYRDVWLRSIRSIVLDGVTARFPKVSRSGGYVIIKEPHGSVGAPLMIEALPESRMVFLVRDPRDVMASARDARREDVGWAKKRRRFSEEDLARFTAKRAEVWMRDIGKAKEAYETHGGPKSMVRYEELRADTLGTMKRIYSELDIPVGEKELARVVEKYAWENIPEEEKGAGKFYRKATPGGWQDDLTPEQAETIEEITAPLLDELYPGWTSVRSGSS